MPGMDDVFLPIDVFNRKSMKKNFKTIKEAFDNEEALIFFPAGYVSRLGLKGIRDLKWFNGAVRFAQKFRSPVLPVYLSGRNSRLFYVLARIYDKFGTFLLPHELYTKKGQTLGMTFGEIIPAKTFNTDEYSYTEKTEKLKEYTYNLAKNPGEIFILKDNIIPALSTKEIEEELAKHSELLGEVGDTVGIYSTTYTDSPKLMDELFRLREITYRSVGEGTGKPKDTDKYDPYYHHIILWHKKNRDIIGSYRLGYTKETLKNYGYEGLYNEQTYIFHEKFNDVLNQSLEVGRSFIQRKYWRSNALDYLWNGIGIFIKKYPDIRYLFGGVSMTDAIPSKGKAMVVGYYKKWYYGTEDYCTEKIPYEIPEEFQAEVDALLVGKDEKEDFRALKKKMAELGTAVPVLYRRYAEMTEYGGAKYYGFSVNPWFNYAVDGLILVDLDQLRPNLRKRYFDNAGFVTQKTKD
jgi:putative hemolysin